FPRAQGFAVRAGQAPTINPCPYLVLEQATRGQRLTPETLRRHAILGEEMGQGDGAIEIDHRSARSWPSSLRSWLSLVTGRRGGGSAPGIAGGVIHPRRTASARRASASSGLRLSRGGPGSATTRSRSVTSKIGRAHV